MAMTASFPCRDTTESLTLPLVRKNTALLGSPWLNTLRFTSYCVVVVPPCNRARKLPESKRTDFSRVRVFRAIRIPPTESPHFHMANSRLPVSPAAGVLQSPRGTEILFIDDL